MATLEEFCTIRASLDMNVIGNTPRGMRIDFPFAGVATSSHWEGERPVSGVDYVTVRADGNMQLDIHGVIGEGRAKVAYTATGVSLAGEERGVAYPQELLVFETADADLAFLNDAVAVALGKGEGNAIELTVWLVRG